LFTCVSTENSLNPEFTIQLTGVSTIDLRTPEISKFTCTTHFNFFPQTKTCFSVLLAPYNDQDMKPTNSNPSRKNNEGFVLLGVFTRQRISQTNKN